MQIIVLFKFNHEYQPAAVTGIEGDVSDILLPAVGDVLRHSDSGKPFIGRVTSRYFEYDLQEGHEIDGKVTVTLCLDRTTVQ